jgi:hydrophobic/amphiphilic exporter-1 (mainly G- bacteria), HAE1 family
VTPAVVCATGTSMIVFLPLVLGGRTEITTWIGEVGRTIIFALACSLFLSLTAIPLALGRFLRAGVGREAGILTRLARLHQRVLGWTLAHRPATAGLAVAVFGIAIAAFMPVDKSTFTASKVEAVSMEYEFADNLNHLEVEKYVTRIESWLQARKDSLHIKSTYSYFTNNQAFTRAYLATGYQHDEGAEALRKQLRQRLPELPGVKLRLRGRDEDSGPSGITVRLFGDPGPRLDGLADEVQRRLARVPGMADVVVGGERGRQEVEVVVDRDRAFGYGLSTARVGGAVSQFFRGRTLARFRGPDGEVQVQARLAESDRSSLAQLDQFPIGAAGQVAVPLASVAEFKTVRTPAGVERQQRRSILAVRGNCDPKRAGEVRKSVEREMNGMSLPVGYSWSFGSGFEESDQTQQEMLLNLVMALVLVYLVMAALFESLLHPFAIMLALPFAFVGIAWICLLTHSPFNLMAQIGLLILIGIVVNNGIVLVYRIHQLRERGVDRAQAIVIAARDRLRPILMTTLTTILGLLPLAVGANSVGDVLYYPLARTVIGGLAASTVLTLVLVPCLYTLLEDGWGLVGRVWRGSPGRA